MDHILPNGTDASGVPSGFSRLALVNECVSYFWDTQGRLRYREPLRGLSSPQYRALFTKLVSVGQEDGVVELDETYDTSQMFRTASLQKQAKKTIALDIDGVLAQYDGVYTNTIGTPVVGSQAFIQQLVDAGFKVVIYSSRPAEAIYAWLNQHQFPSLEIAAAKPMASMFVDDRALMFRGDFPTIFREIQEFHPWWEEEAQ